MPIEDLAREDVVSASPETSVPELAQHMRDENVGSVVIADENTPTGIVTDRDLTTRVLAEEAASSDQTADDVMSTGLCAVGPDAGFYEAAQVMSKNGVRRLPVCDENDELVGIITADDLTELLAEENQQLASVVQAQRPEY
jgi:signal-transduction protein with cAMP-binding, CBS, and nucleotidyltransferase domain